MFLQSEPHVHPRAFARGADGVILCGCHPGDCHYTTGNYYTRRRLTLLMGMLNFMGVAESRLKVAWVSASEGARFAEVMTRLCEPDYGFGRT
jgi:F420-non-reducing hydrogenase iron-sulfur subunit